MPGRSTAMYVFCRSTAIFWLQKLHLCRTKCECCSVVVSLFCLVVAAASVESQPRDVSVNETGTAEFSCIFADTNPKPFVNWTFTNSSGHIVTLQEETRGPGLRKSVVTISPVTRADAGSYRCIVENEFAKVSSSPGHLTVHCK